MPAQSSLTPFVSIQKFNGYNVADTVVIVPSDGTTIPADSTNNPNGYPYVWLQCIVAGNAAVVDAFGKNITITAAVVGTIFAFPVKQVKATGTTASFHGLVSKG